MTVCFVLFFLSFSDRFLFNLIVFYVNFILRSLKLEKERKGGEFVSVRILIPRKKYIHIDTKLIP